MSTETLTLKIPTTLAQERGLQEFQMERALEQYRRGGISFGAAAQKAKVPQSVLARYAYSKGVEPAFSTKTVDEEVLMMP
jgi:hypothetical protein